MLSATSADLSGGLRVSGDMGTIVLGDVSGATLTAGGAIGSLTAFSLSGAKVLAGADLGSDGPLGGGDDTFLPATIGRVKIAGPDRRLAHRRRRRSGRRRRVRHDG